MAITASRPRNNTLRQNWIIHIRIMTSLLKREQPIIQRLPTEKIKEIHDELAVECRAKGLRKPQRTISV